MNKRRFLYSLGSVAMAAATARLAAQSLQHNPFTLGVASGAPSTHGMVLWTRLMAQASAEPLPAVPIEVRWELARDPSFQRLVQTGRELALPEFAHSVHVEIDGLPAVNGAGKGPAHSPHYWYRFMVGDAVSAVGRTRVLPAPDSDEKLTLALASCQNYEHGYFGAYRHMAQEPLDCVLFVGDYIYEYGGTPNRVRQHNSATCHTLDDYRARYALYKSDTDLQAAHAACAWIVTWDDHEVENDYANDRAPSGRGADFLARRAAAYRAYWEHMPLRYAQLPQGPNAQMYRRYAWGRNASLHILDARQYRDHQVCTPADQGGSRTVFDASCPERRNLQSSLLGAQQEAWLTQGISQSSARFNIVGQQSIMAQMRMTAVRPPQTVPTDGFWNDSWDGYPAARQRALAVWGRKANVLSLGGDVHASYVSDLVADFDDPASPVLATEFVGTSISSPSWPQATTERVMRNNPHIKFGKSDQRGYTVLEVEGAKATATLRVVDNARLREPSVSTAARFVVESGRPGAQAA
jgi:alkaline phosphatase D